MPNETEGEYVPTEREQKIIDQQMQGNEDVPLVDSNARAYATEARERWHGRIQKTDPEVIKQVGGLVVERNDDRRTYRGEIKGSNVELVVEIGGIGKKYQADTAESATIDGVALTKEDAAKFKNYIDSIGDAIGVDDRNIKLVNLRDEEEKESQQTKDSAEALGKIIG